jgi:hypothetical protein
LESLKYFNQMDPYPGRTRRIQHAALAAAAVIVGLVVHRVGLGLNPVLRDMLGDALWAFMIFHLLAVLFPSARRWVHIAAALALCFSVETSQRYHAPWLDELRSTLPGHLVLGSGFDPRDFLSYALGVLAAVCLATARRSGRK